MLGRPMSRRERADVDDLAAAARLHARQHGARHEERAVDVGRLQRAPFGGRVLRQRLAQVHGGVVDEDVDRAHRALDLGDAGDDRRFVGDVERAGARRMAGVGEPLRRRRRASRGCGRSRRRARRRCARPRAIASPSPEPPPVTSAIPSGEVERDRRPSSAQSQDVGHVEDAGFAARALARDERDRAQRAAGEELPRRRPMRELDALAGRPRTPPCARPRRRRRASSRSRSCPACARRSRRRRAYTACSARCRPAPSAAASPSRSAVPDGASTLCR